MGAALRLAVSQFPVTGAIAANAGYIARHMRKAAAAGAHVAHFPEAALSGHARIDFECFRGFDWRGLEYHTRRIGELAALLKLWVVLGSARKGAPAQKPRNCLHVISPDGRIAESYDKRKLLGKEKNVFSAGLRPLIMSINGITCGFLICYDSCFPEFYRFYRERGVQLLFHS